MWIQGHYEAAPRAGKVDVYSGDNKGHTPLLWAALRGHKVAVRLLLDTCKVDADSRDNEGQTPLSRAVSCGHKAIVRLLEYHLDRYGAF